MAEYLAQMQKGGRVTRSAVVKEPEDKPPPPPKKPRKPKKEESSQSLKSKLSLKSPKAASKIQKVRRASLSKSITFSARNSSRRSERGASQGSWMEDEDDDDDDIATPVRKKDSSLRMRPNRSQFASTAEVKIEEASLVPEEFKESELPPIVEGPPQPCIII